MSRFPVDEIFWRRTEDSELVSFGRNYSVEIVEPGTEDPLVLWSEEEGGVKVDQPLTTDADGRALGKDGVRPWSTTADYDVLIGGQRYPKRAPAGGGGGGAVDSVAGKTGAVTLDAGDIEGLGDSATRDVGTGSGDVAAGNIAPAIAALLAEAGVGIIVAGKDPETPRGSAFSAYLWIVEGIEPSNKASNDFVFDLETEIGEEEGGAVKSVFGRIGDVIAEAGDYAAADISGLGDAASKNTGTGSTQVAAGDDSRFPTSGQKNALAGLHGTPGTGNEYATKQSIGSAGEAGKALKADDATTTNARTPTAHASSHKTGGSDAIAPSDIGAATTAALSAEASARETADALKADKTYVEGLLNAADAVVFKGSIDCSSNPKYPAADAGHLYRVSKAGFIGSEVGIKVEVGDELLCISDGSPTGNQTAVGENWTIGQANKDGIVTGPTSAGEKHLAAFNGITGKYIEDSEAALSTDGALASNSDAKVPTEKAVKTYADTKLTQATADGLYVPQVPGLVIPIALGGVIVPFSTITTAAKRLYLNRCIIPKTGKLRDISIFVGTSSGKVIATIYDTGDATAEKRTRLYKSAEVAVGTGNEWQVIADPELSVTRGQQIELCFVFDNATVTMARGAAASMSSNGHKLPANFNPVAGGAQPKMYGIAALASFAAPETLKESEVEAATAAPLVIARIS